MLRVESVEGSVYQFNATQIGQMLSKTISTGSRVVNGKGSKLDAERLLRALERIDEFSVQEQHKLFNSVTGGRFPDYDINITIDTSTNGNDIL